MLSTSPDFPWIVSINLHGCDYHAHLSAQETEAQRDEVLLSEITHHLRGGARMQTPVWPPGCTFSQYCRPPPNSFQRAEGTSDLLVGSEAPSPTLIR